jgi:predicted HTH domain antitoxin
MARTLRFEWEVPETVFDDQFPEETFLRQLKVDAVCKLFTAGRLSSGYAASLLGITRRAFFDLLQQHHLPVVQYTEDDFAQDLQTLHTLGASRQDTPGPESHAG